MQSVAARRVNKLSTKAGRDGSRADLTPHPFSCTRKRPCTGPVSDILQRTAYVAAYDRQKRHPAWTAEHLTAAALLRSPSPLPLPSTASASSSSPLAEALVKQQQDRQGIPKGDRANSVFKEDVEVPALFRARLEDYFRSGYDRGHMVPAADAKRSQVGTARQHCCRPRC